MSRTRLFYPASKDEKNRFSKGRKPTVETGATRRHCRIRKEAGRIQNTPDLLILYYFSLRDTRTMTTKLEIQPSKSRTRPSFFLLIIIPFITFLLQVGRRPALNVQELVFEYVGDISANQGGFSSCGNDEFQQTMDLDFVHIPKTGGSTIELAGMHQAQKAWGYFAWAGLEGKAGYYGEKHGNELVNWHTPPFMVSFIAEERLPHYYKGQDIFAVIRNPYTRLVSEIFYRCGLYTDADRRSLCLNKVRVNRRTRRQLTLQLNTVNEVNSSTILDPKVFERSLKRSCHLVPQWQYFYDRFSGEREIRYLLHYEFLAEDFQALMDYHSLNISLGLESRERVTNYFNTQPDGFRGVEDFDKTTLSLIVQLYRKDFELGGYSLNSSDATSFSPWSERNAAGNDAGSTYWELPCKMWF